MNPADVFAELGVKTNVTVLIISMALLVARILPVIIFSPFLGGEVVPTEVKIGLALTLAIVLWPSVEGKIDQIPTGSLLVILLFMKEVFVGICLAFVVSLVFEAAEVAGTLIDTFAGTTMAQVMVPQIQHQVTLFSSLKVQLSVVLFLTLDGHHMVIRALGDSLAVVPLEGFPHFTRGMWAFFDVILRVFSEMFRIGLLLAGPAMLATFLAELGLGAINRVAPQIQVFFIAMSIKPLAATLVTMVALHAVLNRFQVEFQNTFRYLRDAIQLLG